MNKALNDKEIPENWKTSKTCLLEKIAKPTKKDLRPTYSFNRYDIQTNDGNITL